MLELQLSRIRVQTSSFINSCSSNVLIVFRVPAQPPAAASHLLGVVYEGEVRVDEEDILRLQVGVRQLVVMENCRGDTGRQEVKQVG